MPNDHVRFNSTALLGSRLLSNKVVYLGLAIAICRCGGGGPTTPPATASVAGTWSALIPDPIIVDSLVLTVTQSARDSVSGSGVEIVRIPQSDGTPITTPLTVIGAVQGVQVRLVISGPPRTRPKDPELFVGTLANNILQGQDFSNGVEVLGVPVVFHRQN